MHAYIVFWRRKHRTSQSHQEEWSVFVVPSLTLVEGPTRLEGGPTEDWRPKLSMTLIFAAVHLTWPLLWFWLASYQQWEIQWVSQCLICFVRKACKLTYAVPAGIHTPCFSRCTMLFLAACTGIHHIHWLQHFIPLLAGLHHILFIIEVSWVLNHNLYNSMYADSYSHFSNCCRNELIQKLHNFVHLNLCIALSLGLLLFLTGIQTATANIVSDKHTNGM